ncbi:MAG: Zn-ribbon domain-containing OB-fold protein [Chloroflexi bacterium]|nr:Zn-ribbon domain-containing OB-fold protein [Chloroflexota bacterium]
MSKQETTDKRGRAAPRNQPFLEEIEAKPFWANLKEHRLTAQRCSSCSHFRFPPQALCPKCLSSEFEWAPLSGKGKIYSHVTYRRAWHPAYQDKVPYNVSLVELDEGLRMVSNVIDCEPEKVYVGMTVEVVYEDVGDYTLPKFRPVEKKA